ncbi:MAG: nitrile hydratase subunit alpha [Chloroflexi bacterium]|nr:nitrile hydratase subunit alpha [Chloroflexota bacterium]
MTQPAVSAHAHILDPESHVHAVEEDLEYWRTKRLEPRVFLLHRRGVLTLYDLLQAATRLPRVAPGDRSTGSLEERIRALEDGLDEYVRGIALVSLDLPGYDYVIDDTRKERGDYDAFFRISKPSHEGTLEERVARLEEQLRDYSWLLRVLTQALLDKGLLSAERLAAERQRQAGRGAWNGARIVARAWVDPAFKEALLTQGREAVRALDIPPGRLGKLGVAENTATLHNVVVCTLCSCYPHDLLGDPPWWYRSDQYKQQIVRDPRGTLARLFGLTLPEQMEVRVHDSTSDVRWMVLPRRPAGTEGWSEEELAQLVTIESLVGVAEPRAPEEVRRREAAP